MPTCAYAGWLLRISGLQVWLPKNSHKRQMEENGYVSKKSMDFKPQGLELKSWVLGRSGWKLKAPQTCGATEAKASTAHPKRQRKKGAHSFPMLISKDGPSWGSLTDFHGN